MSDLRTILDAWDREWQAGRRAVLATVVRVQGSAYRGPGARMLLRGDGTAVGLVSGGCLEADLAERARSVVESGESRTVVYDLRSPDDIVWGLGLGCSGEIRVLLERLDPDRPTPALDLFRESLERRADAVVAVAFGVTGTDRVRVGDRWRFGADGRRETGPADDVLGPEVERFARRTLDARRTGVFTCATDPGAVDLLVELVEPPVGLVVFGAGQDARPLVRQAASLGWDVTVADPRADVATPGRFPEARRVVPIDTDRVGTRLPTIDARTPCVVLTHHFLHDVRILEFLLGTQTPYIGLLGPRRRAESLLAEVSRSTGTPVALDGRIHGPAGLDLGAETPAEIALSILAEAQARIAGRSAGSLRDRTDPLHPERSRG